MLGTSQYIVASPDLVGPVYRQPNTIAFGPLIMHVTQRMVGFDENTMRIGFQDIFSGGLLPQVHDAAYPHLSTGKAYDEIVNKVLEHEGLFLDKVKGQGEVVDLFAWQREIMGNASMLAIYGPENIWTMDRRLEEDFWNFESGLVGLMVGVFPQYTASKAYYGRKRLVEALVEFNTSDRIKKAGGVVQESYRVRAKNGISEVECAKNELGGMFGFIANAAITTFWVLNYIFSDADLLAEIRNEILKHAVTEDEKKQRTISVTALKTACPLLLSVYREVLRLVGQVPSSRMLVSDTVLAEKYRLKEGSILQIGTSILHTDPAIWGPDAADFNPRRFYNSTAGIVTGTTKQVHPSAFRSFGGGVNQCPGRFFAQNEIVGFAAAVTMKFDLVDPQTGGPLKVAEKVETKIPIGNTKPKHPLMARVRAKGGMEDVRWVLKP